jgi:hypothetical protein
LSLLKVFAKESFFARWPRESALVARTCNPGYSGGRDQEDHSSRPAKKKRKPITKKGLVEWLKVKALSSNPRAARKK